MSQRKIVVIIDNDGETRVEAIGYTGGKCVLATAPLTKALIGTPTHSVKKPEYYQGNYDAKVMERE